MQELFPKETIIRVSDDQNTMWTTKAAYIDRDDRISIVWIMKERVPEDQKVRKIGFKNHLAIACT